MDERVVIITRGRIGIGAAVAQPAASAGLTFSLADRDDGEPARTEGQIEGARSVVAAFADALA